MVFQKYRMHDCQRLTMIMHPEITYQSVVHPAAGHPGEAIF
jgi:hypothetical protein